MNKAVKFGLIGGIGLWLFSKLVSNGASAIGLQEKFALMLGFPKINLAQFSLKNQTLPIEFNNIRIINQSPFGASIDNMYINVQYYSNSQKNWVNWIMQHKSTASFTVEAGNTTLVPPIQLMFPLTTSFITSVFTGDIGNQLRVVANFDFYGIPISIMDETDISAVLKLIKQSNWVIS